MTAQQVPFIYRLALQWLEPAMAVTGAYMAIAKPRDYIDAVSPSATAATYTPEIQIVFDQLAGLMVLFAFTTGVVLRVTHDLEVWKRIMVGILLCDALHVYGAYSSLGPQVFLNPAKWRAIDAANFISHFAFISARLGVLLEVGLGKERKSKTA